MNNYKQLPAGLRDEMRRYIEDRIDPGSFLVAVLENDLVGAFGKADEINQAEMHRIASFLYNELPCRSYGLAWGSPQAVEDWLNRRDQQEQESSSQ